MADIGAFIQRWQAGDERAAEAIYNQYRESTFRLAYGLLGSAADAEETAQDALTYALTRVARYDPQRASFSTWLHTITVSRCRDRQRRRRLPTFSLSRWLQRGGDTPDPAPTPEGRAAQAETCSEVWMAVQELSPHLREAILLRYWAGKPAAVEFIMEITGGSNPFSGPVDVAVDQAGNLYVVDGFNHRIQKFDPDGQFLSLWGGRGDGDGEFNFSFDFNVADASIAVDEQDNVYVADSANARIQKFNSAGEFLGQWGSYGLEDGQFLAPTGVAVDRAGNVYVADQRRDDVQKFNGEGQFLAKWGSRGQEEGQLNKAFHLALDPAGNVYLADAGNQRVNKFDPAGQFLRAWGGTGSAEGQFLGPYGITADSQGHIYVSDRFNHRVQLFDDQGQYLSQWGTLGSGPTQFRTPGGLAVDRSGFIYVADYENDRIQKFRLAGAPVRETEKGN